MALIEKDLCTNGSPKLHRASTRQLPYRSIRRLTLSPRQLASRPRRAARFAVPIAESLIREPPRYPRSRISATSGRLYLGKTQDARERHFDNFYASHFFKDAIPCMTLSFCSNAAVKASWASSLANCRASLRLTTACKADAPNNHSLS